MRYIERTILAVKLNKTVKELIEKENEIKEQRKNLNPNKKYILDPFVGYIEK